MNDTLIQNFQLRFRAGARLLTASLLTARDNLGGKGCALLVRSNFELLGGLQRVSTTQRCERALHFLVCPAMLLGLLFLYVYGSTVFILISLWMVGWAASVS